MNDCRKPRNISRQTVRRSRSESGTIKDEGYGLTHNAYFTMKNQYVFLRGSGQANWLQQWRHHAMDCICLRKNRREVINCLQNIDLRLRCEIWRADSGGCEDFHLQGIYWAGQLKR